VVWILNTEVIYDRGGQFYRFTRGNCAQYRRKLL